MRETTRSATVVWLGALVGLLLWIDFWFMPLAFPQEGYRDAHAVLAYGLYTIPIYLPALLAWYGLHTGKAPCCRVAQMGYAGYVALLSLALVYCESAGVGEAHADPLLMVVVAVCALLSGLVGWLYLRSASLRAETEFSV